MTTTHIIAQHILQELGLEGPVDTYNLYPHATTIKHHTYPNKWLLTIHHDTNIITTPNIVQGRRHSAHPLGIHRCSFHLSDPNCLQQVIESVRESTKIWDATPNRWLDLV